MSKNIRQVPFILALAMALLSPVALLAADTQVAPPALAQKAIAFVHTMARADFKTVEMDFTDQMKQAAPPEKLGELWQTLLNQAGSFLGTGDSKSVVQGSYTTVNVRTNFKHEAIGIAVSFDSASRIVGMHIVSPP